MKKSGLPSSAFEIRALVSKPGVVEEPVRSITSAQTEQAVTDAERMEIADALFLARRMILNFRQSKALSLVIDFCSNETFTTYPKIKKNIVNAYSILHFSTLSDEQIDAFLAEDEVELYRRILSGFGMNPQEIDPILDESKSWTQTTFETNNFGVQTLDGLVRRVKGLPAVARLKAELVARGRMLRWENIYDATHIRERAVLYYASRSRSEKAEILRGVEQKFAELTKRISEPKYRENITSIFGSSIPEKYRWPDPSGDSNGPIVSSDT